MPIQFLCGVGALAGRLTVLCPRGTSLRSGPAVRPTGFRPAEGALGAEAAEGADGAELQDCAGAVDLRPITIRELAGTDSRKAEGCWPRRMSGDVVPGGGLSCLSSVSD